MQFVNKPGLTRLLKARRCYIDHPEGVSDKDMQIILGVSQSTISRYRALFDAQQVSPGKYTVMPDELDIDYADAVYRRTHGLTIADLATKNEKPWYNRWQK